ncbi:Rubredoxin [Planktothrix serta PCC 8927]|uniref:Rubredoxin n=1 Tax=Planktothrix serta PCC 8927 TaxID=671068 RepID=A0A7Z9C0T8_9CYAN|nr:rubredoxin [Planktothrix serta]VXD24997.1 Rubredoxin [Planktothrix serta PCC 8927]
MPATEVTALDRHECKACGYVYEPAKGSSNVPAGTAFTDLPQKWRCPVCGAPSSQFVNIGSVENPSGFEENRGYGFGVNTLTAQQKNLLIFGGLALGFLFFISLYGLN